jgi:hypothetical protein
MRLLLKGLQTAHSIKRQRQDDAERIISFMVDHNLQRLGYILERVGAGDRAAALAQWIQSRKPRNTPLRTGKSTRGQPLDRRFGVIVNEDIETEK